MPTASEESFLIRSVSLSPWAHAADYVIIRRARTQIPYLRIMVNMFLGQDADMFSSSGKFKNSSSKENDSGDFVQDDAELIQ